jgi:MATE family multidrug resistance protein
MTMRPFEPPRRDDMTALIRLAVPVVVVQVGMMLLGVVDTMVVGRYSAEALAAVAIGHVVVVAASAFGVGVLLALDPLVSQAVGADDPVAARRAMQRGLALAVILMVPTIAVIMPVKGLLTVLRQPAEIIPLASAYVLICLPGLLPFYAFFVLRISLQAMERMRPIVVTIVVVNLFNLVADWALVFGAGPLPRLGPIGSAWASTAARTLLLLVLVVLSRRELAPMIGRLDREAFRLPPLWRTLKLGLPIGVQLELEIVAFSVVALLMGGLGTIQMAAHQVTINLASLTFMVPLGIGSAAAIRVGHAIGAGDGLAARRSASAGLLLGTGFMTTTGILFITLPEAFASAYTPLTEVVSLAAVLIPIAGFFQIFDGLQIVGAGVLRGAGDTRAPMVINLLGFWLLGLPASLALAYGLDLGPVGLWWGLVVGLGAVAAFMLARVVAKLRRRIVRLQVD